MEPTTLQPGQYRHYKGGLYEVTGIARHTETLEAMVVYKSLNQSKEYEAGSLWIRPLVMFCENVMVNGKEVPRFELVRNN